MISPGACPVDGWGKACGKDDYGGKDSKGWFGKYGSQGEAMGDFWGNQGGGWGKDGGEQGKDGWGKDGGQQGEWQGW